jgi:hypothetical protein
MCRFSLLMAAASIDGALAARLREKLFAIRGHLAGV